MTEWIISSIVLILVVTLVRQVLKGKISLRLQYALWAIVLVRLLVPITFGESKISVLNVLEQAASVVEQQEPEVPTQNVPENPTVTVPVGGGPGISDKEETPGISIDIPPQKWGNDDWKPQTAPEITQSPDGTLSEDWDSWEEEQDAAWEKYKEEHTRHVTITVPQILTLLWLSGIAMVGLWFLFTNLRFWLRLRRSRQLLELDCPIRVYVTGAVETPCLFGLIRPAVYLTPEVAEDEVALRHVLAHELTHYRHWDHIWSVLRCVCLAVHWYNPLVWLAASLSRRDAELACDESTIRRIGEEERTAYGRTLIGLTCVHRSNLLHTATTMTGSKKSIKERIVLIAKKPKMAIYTLVAVILIAAIAVGCTFTGAKGPTLIDWTSTITAEEIGSAQIITGQMPDQKKYDLTEDNIDELISIFRTITEDQLTLENPGELGLGVNIEYSLYVSTPTQGDPWLGWQFQCLGDGTVMLTFRDFETAKQYGYTEKTGINPRIRNDALYRFITSNGQLAVQQDTPQAVLDCAERVLADQLAEHIQENGKGERTELIGLKQHKMQKIAGLDDAVFVYRITYNLHWGNAFEYHQHYMVLGYNSFTDEYTLLGDFSADELVTLYGTEEMLAKYDGDMFVAAAMEAYAEWKNDNLEPADPNAELITYFQELLTWDGGTTHFNGALTCAFNSPEDINLEYVFYNRFPGGEEWSDFTEEEKAYLIAEGAKKNLGFGAIPAQKRSAKQLEQALQAYFGVSLSQVQIPNSWVYYEATDSYYSSHGDTHVMQNFTVTKVEQGMDGLIYVYYTATGPIYRQDGTTLDGWEHNMVLTLRSIASNWGSPNDSGYMVLANQTVNAGQPVTQPDIQQIVNGILVGELSYDDSWQSMGNYTLTAIGADDRIDTYACVPRTFYALEHTPGYKLMNEYKWTQVDRFQWTGMAGNKYSLQFANDNYSFTVYCNENKLEIQAYGKVFYFVGTPNTSFKYRDYSDLFLDFLSYAESARHAYELNACWVDGSETDYDVIARKLAEQYAQTILNRPDWCQQQAQDARVNAVEVFDAYYGADNPNFCFNKMLYLKMSDEQRNDWEVGAGLYGPLTDGMYSGYFEHSLEVNVVKCEDGNWRMVSMGTGGAEVYLPAALDNATTKQLMELYFLTEGQTHDWWIRDRLLRKPLEEVKQELNMLGLGYRLQLSKALLEYTVEQPHLAAWTADDFNAHSDLHVATNGEGLTFRAEGVTDAAEEFTQVYGEALMACYDFILDYECSYLELVEASKEGDAVIAWFRFDVQPEEGADQRFASAVFEERQDGRMRSAADFLLEKVGEDLWSCTVYDSGSQLFLEDYGYEDALIRGILYSPDVVHCKGTDPIKAAEELMVAYLDALKEPADLRSFTITEYRNLAVSVTSTLQITGFALDEYRLKEDEIGENTWIVEISEIEYQWDGVLHDPPCGPSAPADYWETLVHQGSGGCGFLLTQNGNEFTLYSRWGIRN